MQCDIQHLQSSITELHLYGGNNIPNKYINFNTNFCRRNIKYFNNLIVSHSTYGRRAFTIAGPTTWNSLPTHLHRVENSTAAFGRLLSFVF